MERPSISEYFRNKTVLLTGASGFVGKVILEKLLRSCPEIHTVYVLVRFKRGKTSQQRMKMILDEPLFSKLQVSQPNFKDKIIVIEGDLLQDGLGLSREDRLRLTSSTQVLIHAAADVRFTAQLRYALEVNVMSVKKLITLCNEMQNIEVLCHISTAWSNCNQNEMIKEKVYPVRLDPQAVLDLTSHMSDEAIAEITPELLNRFPNTYTYTKCLAEYLLQEANLGFPCCIFRPPLVVPAFHDPLPGWIDNINGLSGLSVLFSTGLTRVICCDANVAMDISPADHCASAIIAATWKTASDSDTSVIVYNHTGFHLSHGELKQRFENIMTYTSPQRILRAPYMWIVTNTYLYLFWSIIYHWIPGILIDGVIILTGKKPRLLKTYYKYEKAIKELAAVGSRKCQWENKNLHTLRTRLTDADKKTFSWSLESSMLAEYFDSFAVGIKHYILKEEVNTKKDMRVQRRFRVAGWILWLVIHFLLLYLLLWLLHPLNIGDKIAKTLHQALN